MTQQLARVARSCPIGTQPPRVGDLSHHFQSIERGDRAGEHPHASLQDKSGAKAEVEAVGGDYEKVCNGGCLTKSQCQQLLSKEVSAAASGAEGIFGQQCSCIMAVLTDMTYNLVRPAALRPRQWPSK